MHRYLKEHEEKQLFKTIAAASGLDAQRDYAWMQFLRNTGVRISVLANLTLGEAKAIIASQHITLPAMKGGEEAQVFVNKKAVSALKTLIHVRRQFGFAVIDSMPLIMGYKNKGMSIRNFQSRMKYWRELANLPVQASPHWWRHTLGKRIIKNSTSPDALNIAQKALNHSSIQSTGIYTEADREDVEAALEEVSS
jgi:site-specific recombinase XerD